MRVLTLDASLNPRQRGRVHGETFRGEIQSLCELREYLTVRRGGFDNPETVQSIARSHLPVLRAFDDDLHAEIAGIAEGAAVAPERIVILNHYTDLRDLGPAIRSAPPQSDGSRDRSIDPPDATTEGCSLIFASTRDGPLLAQTWDMHATSIPYVMMIHLEAPETDPDSEAWLLSLTGCVGMAGGNRAGVAVGINNLRSLDACVGVVWPALIRSLLRQPRATQGRDLLLRQPIGSGHHYCIADREYAVAIETSGQLRVTTYEAAPIDERSVYWHTNHCLDPRVAACSTVPANSSTYARYQVLERRLGERPLQGSRDAWELLGSQEGYPASICTNLATGSDPHGTATAAGIVIDIAGREILAVAGFPHNVEPARFHFE